jgi:hypothetical protein
MVHDLRSGQPECGPGGGVTAGPQARTSPTLICKSLWSKVTHNEKGIQMGRRWIGNFIHGMGSVISIGPVQRKRYYFYRVQHKDTVQRAWESVAGSLWSSLHAIDDEYHLIDVINAEIHCRGGACGSNQRAKPAFLAAKPDGRAHPITNKRGEPFRGGDSNAARASF